MIVSVLEVRAHLNLSDGEDDLLLHRKIEAAQNHLERLLGFKIEESFPPVGDPPESTIPAALAEAVCQLVAHWYENREATLVGVSAQELPHGVWEIVNEYRTWSW